MKELTNPPPAHVRVVNKELEDLAFQANTAHAAGESAVRGGLERFREAGQLLLKAKEVCPYGQWGPWCKENLTMSKRIIEQYLKLTAYWHLCQGAKTLREAIKVLYAKEEELKFEILCRDCRINGAKPDCPECAKLRKKKSRRSGKVLLDWNKFGKSFSYLKNWQFRLYEVHGLIDDKGAPVRDPVLSKCDQWLNDWFNTIRQRYEELAKVKAPDI